MSDEQNRPASAGDPDKPLQHRASRSGALNAKNTSTRDREKTPERRQRRRAMISAPVRVRGVDASHRTLDEISTTLDVSRNGFLFLTAQSGFSRGMIVAVTFPYSKSPAAVQAEQPGRVVRVSETTDGRFAVAIAIIPGTREVHIDAFAAAGLERKIEHACSDKATTPFTAPADHRPLVIVVDSDPGVRDLLRTFLEERGYEVMALQSARQAHALLDQMLPELVIAEIEGRDLPGYDLCARIKSTERLRGVPVVLMTQSASPSDYSNAHSLGAVVCIAKPFRMERIEHVVRLLAPTTAARRQTGAPGPGQRDRRSGFDRRRKSDPGRRSTGRS